MNLIKSEEFLKEEDNFKNFLKAVNSYATSKSDKALSLLVDLTENTVICYIMKGPQKIIKHTFFKNKITDTFYESRQSVDMKQIHNSLVSLLNSNLI